ncbi:hypothetical protein L1766_09030 [Thermovorax subterraneus]|nr:hypothetical protein [Thermovorax subterraneus]
MIIKINLFPPYSIILNKKEINLEVEGTSASFKDVLKEFMKKYPQVKDLLPSDEDRDRVYGNLVPVRNGKVIFLNEEIFENDVIDFFGSLSGG